MDHPYAAFLARVQRPARYVGGEYGAVAKDPADVDARIVLAFPDVYEVGMSHLGMRILYSAVNRHPRLAAERVFAPWPDLESRLREGGSSLVSLESAKPLADFDFIGFSLQFELTYTNVLAMIDLARLPLRQRDRREGDPLVIAGGPTATHSEPLAPFLDAIVLGDGEEILPRILLEDAESRRRGIDRAERLVRLASLPGVYVPSSYETRLDERTRFEVVGRPRRAGVTARVERALVADLSSHPFPTDGPVPATEAVFERAAVEIARGCTEGCRFCQAGMIYRPVRERVPDETIDAILRSVRRDGYDRASLTSLSTADCSCIAPLVRTLSERLAAQRVALGISSLRAYGLGEDTLDDVARLGATGLTFAPEAGTQRMRDVVNKNVTEAQLLETAERVFEHGWERMKLYFMIGLPTERDEDVLGIVETGAKAMAVGRRTLRGRRPKIAVSVSTHVPKPHTPFQWAAMDSLAEVERKQRLLSSAARGTGVELRYHEATASMLECVLARGDRSLADAIERAYRLGCRFDSWREHLRIDLWRRAFADCNVDLERVLGAIPLESTLPWDHVDVGLEDGFLRREWEKALRGRRSPPCGKPVGSFVHPANVAEATGEGRRLVCWDCGVACDMDQMRRRRIDHLASLGALEPVAARPAPGAAAGRRWGRPQPRTAFAASPAHRWRFSFAKRGPAVYLGHLDLVRHLSRVFRRAGLVVAYSRGFRPKPRIALGAALPLGVVGLEEWLDVVLGESPDPETVCDRLRAVSPDGIDFLSARPLADGEPSVGRSIALADSLVWAPRGTLDVDAVAAAARTIDGPRVVVRRTPKGNRAIDVAPWVVSVRLASADDLAAAGLDAGTEAARVRVRISGDGGARPEEVARALLGLGDPPAEDADSLCVVRIGLFAEGEGGKPMSLSAPLPGNHLGGREGGGSRTGKREEVRCE